MHMDQHPSGNFIPGSPGYARLHEFNFLPSRYIHPQQASALLPASWCECLAGGASARVHAHLSAYLLERLQIDHAWVVAAGSFAAKLALLDTSTLDALVSRLGLALLGQPIRQCVRREQMQQLNAALTAQEWEFVFHAAAFDSPSVLTMGGALFEQPRAAIRGVGHAALQQLTAGLEAAGQVRLGLKMPLDLPTLPHVPELSEADGAPGLLVLCKAILDELDPDWDFAAPEVAS